MNNLLNSKLTINNKNEFLECFLFQRAEIDQFERLLDWILRLIL